MKCSQCAMVATLRCKDCVSVYCYHCDERSHSRLDRHTRITISFRESQIKSRTLHQSGSFVQRNEILIESKLSSRNQSRQSEIQVMSRMGTEQDVDEDQKLMREIATKQKAIADLKSKQENQINKHKLIAKQIRDKYEKEIQSLETRLMNTANDLDRLTENQDMENVQAKIVEMEEKFQSELQETEDESRSVELRISKTTQFMEKIEQTSSLQEQQIEKINEILKIFKMSSENMQKDKELLLLENEKLISEVELFSKFFEDNAEILEKLGS